MSEEIICSLCLDNLTCSVDEFERVKRAVVLPGCYHCFHFSCIVSAHSAQKAISLDAHLKCPLCNKPHNTTRGEATFYPWLFLSSAPIDVDNDTPHRPTQPPAPVSSSAASFFRLADELKGAGNGLPKVAKEYMRLVKGAMEGGHVDANRATALKQQMETKLNAALTSLQEEKARATLKHHADIFSSQAEIIMKILQVDDALLTRQIDTLHSLTALRSTHETIVRENNRFAEDASKLVDVLERWRDRAKAAENELAMVKNELKDERVEKTYILADWSKKVNELAQQSSTDREQKAEMMATIGGLRDELDITTREMDELRTALQHSQQLHRHSPSLWSSPSPPQPFQFGPQQSQRPIHLSHRSPNPFLRIDDRTPFGTSQADNTHASLKRPASPTTGSNKRRAGQNDGWVGV